MVSYSSSSFCNHFLTAVCFVGPCEDEDGKDYQQYGVIGHGDNSLWSYGQEVLIDEVGISKRNDSAYVFCENSKKRKIQMGLFNSPVNQYCGRCGLILDEGERVKADIKSRQFERDFTDLAVGDPGLLEEMRKFLEMIELFEKKPVLFNKMKAMIEGIP
jgi:hypothetical protein